SEESGGPSEPVEIAVLTEPAAQDQLEELPGWQEAVAVAATDDEPKPRPRFNPWVAALWWLTLPALGGGAALQETAEGLAASIGSTLTTVGSMGLVGAFVVAGIDWRLRRQY
ncbi:MAG: hypothetical protein FWG16_06635, partial [Micrococcales bacterium]|nr:hypothetical protein [Micrococcales bacterium]